MRIWGKVLGAFFGFLLGNIFGALLGLWIGHRFDRGMGIRGAFQRAPSQQQQRGAGCQGRHSGEQGMHCQSSTQNLGFALVSTALQSPEKSPAPPTSVSSRVYSLRRATANTSLATGSTSCASPRRVTIAWRKWAGTST